MSPEEMAEVVDALARVLNTKFENVQVNEYEPPGLPEVYCTIAGQDVCLTVGPL